MHACKSLSLSIYIYIYIERDIDIHSSQGQFHNGDKCGRGKFTWNTGGSYEASRT